MNAPLLFTVALVLLLPTFATLAQPHAPTTPRPRHYVVRDLDGELRHIEGQFSNAHTSVTAADGQWDAVFEGNGLGAWSIDAIATTTSKIYVAGTFNEVDGVPATDVAMYDRRTRTWSSLGGVGTNGWITSIAVNGENVYIGGRFTHVGQTSAENIARFDGQLWHSVGDGMAQATGASVTALAIYRGALIAAGRFNAGVDAVDIARLDFDTWRSIGIRSTGTVTALSVHDDELIVGGIRIRVGDSIVGNVTGWNGERWRSLNANLQSLDYPRCFASGKSGELYIGGNFRSDSLEVVAQWDGSTWRRVGGGLRRRRFGLQPNLKALAVGPNGDLFAGGHYIDSAGERKAFDIARFSGGDWNEVGGGAYHGVNALSFAGDTLIVGGTFTQVGAVVAHGLAAWVNESWGTFGRVHGNGGIVYELARAANGDIIVGGDFNSAGDIGVNNIARFDGSNWHPFGLGTNGPVEAMHVDEQDNLYVAGTRPGVARAGIAPTENLAVWSGSEWSAHAQRWQYGGQVHVITSNQNGLYVGGNGMTIDSLQSALVLWDGQQWRDVGGIGTSTDGLFVGSKVEALLVDGDGVYAGGSFDTSSSGPLNNVARWDGARWDPLDGGVQTVELYSVTSLAKWNDDLLVGGGLLSTDGSSMTGLARFDIESSVWQPIADIDAHVYAMTVVGGDLYLAGSFISSQGDNVARYDGAELRGIGGGLDRLAYAIVADSMGRIYVGGMFQNAGETESSAIARWTPTTLVVNDDLTPMPMRGMVIPNPATHDASLSFTLARAAHVRVTIVDAIGSVNMTLSDDYLSAGDQHTSFDASRLESGTYFVRMLIDGDVASVRLNVAR